MRFLSSLSTFYRYLFFSSSTCPRPLSASPCFWFSKRLHAPIPLSATFPPHVSNRNSLIQWKKEYFSCRLSFATVFFEVVLCVQLRINTATGFSLGRRRKKRRYLFCKNLTEIFPNFILFNSNSIDTSSICWFPLTLMTLGYRIPYVWDIATTLNRRAARRENTSKLRFTGRRDCFEEFPIHGIRDKGSKARCGRMRKPTGRHRSDGSSASDSPRATYARALVRSLARLIIQLISPGHSPHLWLSPASYELRVLHTPNKLRRICSECNSWYSRAPKHVVWRSSDLPDFAEILTLK